MKWKLNQTNGAVQVVPCPFISNDLVPIKDLMPVKLYNERGELQVVSVNDKDDVGEADDQIVGTWSGGWSDITVDIRQWRWDLLGTDFTIVLYGKRRTGKTHFMEPMLYQLRPYYTFVVVFTKTGFNGDLARLFPKSLIIDDFNDAVVNAILDEQKARAEKSRAGPEPHPNCRMLMVFDDVLSAEVSYRYSKSMERIFYEGRHYKMSIMCTSQDSKGLPPALKQNTDVHIMFPMQGKRDRETVAENVLPFLVNDRDVRAFLSDVLAFKHQALIIVNCKGSRPLYQQVYVGIATPKEDIPKFVMGTYECWRDDLAQLAALDFEYLRDDPSFENWNIQPYMPPKPVTKHRDDGMHKRPAKFQGHHDDDHSKRGRFDFILPVPPR